MWEEEVKKTKIHDLELSEARDKRNYLKGRQVTAGKGEKTGIISHKTAQKEETIKNIYSFNSEHLSGNVLPWQLVNWKVAQSTLSRCCCPARLILPPLLTAASGTMATIVENLPAMHC